MAIDAETERMMRNWARWKTGAPIGLSVTGAYDLEAHGRREERPVPLLNGEAIDVDRFVLGLPAELYEAVWEYWIRKGTIADKARRCHCSQATLYRRLEDAHYRVRLDMEACRKRSAPMTPSQQATPPLCMHCQRKHWLRDPCAAPLQTPFPA